MRYRYSVLALAALSLLSSCGGEIIAYKATVAGLFAAGHGVFSRPDVNLKEKNYAAADFMAVQMENHVGKNRAILVKPLEQMDHAGISSPLGESISEGIGLRFTDLGYKVWLHEVAANGNAGLYPAPPKGVWADFVLSGTYAVQREHVDVALRLIDMSSSQVVAHFDYALLLSREVRELSQTETRIFRVSE